jgi:hypothetical protein
MFANIKRLMKKNDNHFINSNNICYPRSLTMLYCGYLWGKIRLLDARCYNLFVLLRVHATDCQLCCCISNFMLSWGPTLLVLFLVYIVHRYIPRYLLPYLYKNGVTGNTEQLFMCIIIFLCIHTAICLFIFKFIFTPVTTKWLLFRYCKSTVRLFIDAKCTLGIFGFLNKILIFIVIYFLLCGLYHMWKFIKTFTENKK